MVCKDFYNAVQHNDELWKNLADTVWVIARVPRVRPSSAETAATDTVRSFYQAECRRRHELDRHVEQVVYSMAESLLDLYALRRVLLRGFQWGRGLPTAERLDQSFSISADIANIAAHSNDPVQALDGLRRYVLAGPGRERRSATIYCVT
jgi:hypothetical protein